MFNVFLCFLIKLLLLLLLLCLPKPCTDRFAHVNGTQPMFSLYGGSFARHGLLAAFWRGYFCWGKSTSVKMERAFTCQNCQANFSTFYYNSLIQHYRKRKCIKCGSTPDDPAVCLVCGKFTCLQGNCCVDETGESRHYECIQVCHVTSNLVSATTWIYWFELQN